MDSKQIYEAVTAHYSAVSRDRPQNGAYGKSVAQAFGYTAQELASIPTDANLGLSCGNPLAIASLKEGETVVDLGSGAGFDVFLAAKKVGTTGRAIGVDMNKDMLALANKNKVKAGSDNVEFVEGEINRVPLPDGVADAIISNCVINLVPASEKHLVFTEMFRLLKPGGRVAVSDILARKPLPEPLQNSVAAYCGCISGASLVAEYTTYLKDAGFYEVIIQDTEADLNVYTTAMTEDGVRNEASGETSNPETSAGCASTAPGGTGCCAPKASKAEDGSSPATLQGAGCCFREAEDNPGVTTVVAGLGETDLNDWVGSYRIFAVKP